jgi:hypothetical protein
MDHPHSDPGDGRTECHTCGKWVWEVTHSCKRVPVTVAAWNRLLDDHVEAWHQSPLSDPTPLHEYLGMTWDEYGAWVKDPSAIPARWLS